MKAKTYYDEEGDDDDDHDHDDNHDDDDRKETLIGSKKFVKGPSLVMFARTCM